MTEGAVSNDLRGTGNPHFFPSGDPGTIGGGTYNAQSSEPTIRDYENFFGPAARDIKQDPERNRRRQRWHLPDALQGSNPWLADRIDGLITDTTTSPFTTIILPYKHIDNVDGKIKWNVWSFDEGMASRVPYESSARVLTQTKRSFAGYTVRQGLAIVMEANFMMSQAGQENFRNQVQQVVHSIQYTNNLDVHVALIQAPSYQKHVDERYWNNSKTNSQLIRDYVDMFGFMQKNPNALDIAIEEAKEVLRSWGAKEPSFLLCNSKLTMQLQMNPERTQYFTQGEDGVRRLKEGPNINKYRGLNIIHSHSFSVENGARPRDLLTRRVRVGEYYRVTPRMIGARQGIQLYDESRDTWFTLNKGDLIRHATYGKDIDFGCWKLDDPDKQCAEFLTKEWSGFYGEVFEMLHEQAPESATKLTNCTTDPRYPFDDVLTEFKTKAISATVTYTGLTAEQEKQLENHISHIYQVNTGCTAKDGDNFASVNVKRLITALVFTRYYTEMGKGSKGKQLFYFIMLVSRVISAEHRLMEFVILRPNIEHNMHAVILGRGGMEDLGATLWGQTQLECYSDSVHGIWGMSYKYNERAIVFNEKNLVRFWDVSYASYSGGKDSRILHWENNIDDCNAMPNFLANNENINAPYNGPSVIVLAFDRGIHTNTYQTNWESPVSMRLPSDLKVGPVHPEGDMCDSITDVLDETNYSLPGEYMKVLDAIHRKHAETKGPGACAHENITGVYGSVYFQGSMRVIDMTGHIVNEINGSGHHGPDYVGVASRRNGKGVSTSRGPGVPVFGLT